MRNIRSKQAAVTLLLVVFMMVGVMGCGQKTSNSSDAGASGDKVITLKVADIYPTTHYVSQGLQLWMKKTEELTNGKVKFTLYPSEQLGKSSDMLSILSSGVADVAYVPFPYFAAQMPLISGAGAISGVWSNCTEGNPAVYQVCTEDPVLTNDFIRNGIRPVLPFANQTFQLFTNKKEVKSLEDIKGMKIRSSGGVMDSIIKSFGAVPVQIPVGELYEAMSRGTVDGTLISAVALHSNKIEEAAKYATWGINVSGGIFGYCINEKVWQSLPEDVQTAMVTAAGEALDSLGATMDADDAKFKEQYKTQGMTVYELSPQEKEVWVQAQASVKDTWIKDMESKNLPGQAVLNELYAGVEKARTGK